MIVYVFNQMTRMVEVNFDYNQRSTDSIVLEILENFLVEPKKSLRLLRESLSLLLLDG